MSTKHIEVNGMTFKIGLRGLVFRNNGEEWVRSTKSLAQITCFIHQAKIRNASYMKSYNKLLKKKYTHDDAVLALI